MIENGPQSSRNGPFAGAGLSVPDEVIYTILEAANLHGSSTIVDLGSGYGNVTRTLAKFVSLIYAVEINPELTLAAIKNNGASNIHFLCDDVHGLRLPHPVDGIFAFESFHLFGYKGDLAQNLRLLCRSGGAMAVAWCEYGWENLIKTEAYSVYDELGISYDNWGFQDCSWLLGDAPFVRAFPGLVLEEIQVAHRFPAAEIAYFLASVSYMEQYSLDVRKRVSDRMLEIVVNSLGHNDWIGPIRYRFVHNRAVP